MEDNSLVLVNKEKNELFTFSRGLNYSDNRFLFKNLISNKPIDEDSLIGLKSKKETTLITIKVNVKDTGVFLFYFDSEKLSNERRETLLKEISELKSLEDRHIEKVQNLLKIVNNYEPVFGSFYDDNQDVLTKGFFALEFKKNFNLTLIVFFHEEVFAKRPPEFKGLRKFFNVFKNAYFKIYYSIKTLFVSSSKKPIKEKPTKVEKEKKQPKLYKYIFFEIDFIFMAVFAVIASFSLLAGISYVQKGDALCAFLFVLFGVFVGILCYSSYSYKKEHRKTWKYNLENLLMPITFAFLGFIGGIVASYFTSMAIIKNDSEPFVNFGLSLYITIGASVFILICFVLTPVVFDLIFKNKKENVKKEKK